MKRIIFIFIVLLMGWKVYLPSPAHGSTARKEICGKNRKSDYN